MAQQKYFGLTSRIDYSFGVMELFVHGANPDIVMNPAMLTVNSTNRCRILNSIKYVHSDPWHIYKHLAAGAGGKADSEHPFLRGTQLMTRIYADGLRVARNILRKAGANDPVN